MNTPEALKDHLARRGLNADVHQVLSHTSEIHDVILSFAADVCADMLVMGGYGHSRLRERVLGGVTRGIFGDNDRAGADFALTPLDPSQSPQWHQP